MSHSQPLNIEAILAVFRRFAQFETPPDQQPPSSAQGPAPPPVLGYEEGVSTKIRDAHRAGGPIPLLLPAAPFKNPAAHKVLHTTSPDFGEELGLARLNHLCDELAKVYPFGAELTMVSDGPVYCDLLCVPSSDFYDYGVRLRQMAADNGFTRIRFRRLADVLGIADGDALSKDEYLALVDTCRSELETRFLPEGLEIRDRIENHKDTAMTYQGFVKLANEDLRWGPELDPEIRDDEEKYGEASKRVGEKMTERLLAYEKSLEAVYPGHIRLSIHRSTGKSKISIPLIPQEEGFGLMPWHGCVLVTAQGRYVTGYSQDYRDESKYEIVYKNDRPYFVRERHEDFEWPAHVNISHKYGGKVVLENTRSQEEELREELKLKLANLAVRFGEVQVVGFRA